MTVKKYRDHFHFVYWWMIYSPRADSAKSPSNAFEKLPEVMWNLTSEPEYISLSDDFKGYEFDDDHFLDVIEANIIMHKLDPLEVRILAAETFIYVQCESKNIGHESMRRKALKLAKINSSRLFADKLRTGISKVNWELRSRKMIRR